MFRFIAKRNKKLISKIYHSFWKIIFLHFKFTKRCWAPPFFKNWCPFIGYSHNALRIMRNKFWRLKKIPHCVKVLKHKSHFLRQAKETAPAKKYVNSRFSLATKAPGLWWIMVVVNCYFKYGVLVPCVVSFVFITVVRHSNVI